MTSIKLGHFPKSIYKWKKLSRDSEAYQLKEVGGYQIVKINVRLWDKIKSIIDIRQKGYDAIILIDGKRRTGKSTLAKTIAYLLNPEMTINNYVSGLEEAPEKIEKAKIEDVLVFDEGSLVGSSKDVMAKKNKQLEKIIDVVGQKRLCLIFCMPDYVDMSKAIAISHSKFLLRVYHNKNLDRGNFSYIGELNKKRAYHYAKKHYGVFDEKLVEWDGDFYDFKLSFEEEYDKIKLASLKEALTSGNVKNKVQTESEYKTMIIKKMRANAPEMSVTLIARATGFSTREIYRRLEK